MPQRSSVRRNAYHARVRAAARRKAPAAPHRAAAPRAANAKPPSARDRRRMLQLLCSGAVLVVAIAVKLLMPDVLAEYRARLLALLGTDTDFVEVFSAAGRAFSSEGAIGGALNDAYTAVFGPSVPTETPTPTAAVYTPDAQPANTELLQRVLGFAYASPVTGQLSSGFGLRTDPLEGGRRFHYGLDIAAEEGAVVSSFADGTVTAVGESSELGRYVTVSHPNGYATLYAHCTRITASSGQRVSRGDPIAEVGETGRATGNHLHFELHHGSTYLNPIYYVAFR